jgi:hypothetical protein
MRLFSLFLSPALCVSSCHASSGDTDAVAAVSEERLLQGFGTGGGLTRAPTASAGTPSASPPTTVTQAPQREQPTSVGSPTTPATAPSDPNLVGEVSASYTYQLYTSAADLGTAVGEVHAHVKGRILEDLAETDDVTFKSMTDVLLGSCSGSPSGENVPSWVDDSFALCGRYNTTVRADVQVQWDEDVFRRTSVQIIRSYIDGWNTVPRSSFLQFESPLLVTSQVSLFFVGGSQLMSIYEYSLTADTLELSLVPKGLQNENPEFTIVDVEFLWQRILPRNSAGPGTRGRQLQSAPHSNQVQLLITAECAGEVCSDEAFGTFVRDTIPEINDSSLSALKLWSQTNYFDVIDAIVLNPNEDASLIDNPDLPPPSDITDPGLQEEDSPIWIWLVLLICAGCIFAAVVYSTCCLGARDVKATRQLREEKRKSAARRGVEEPPAAIIIDQEMGDPMEEEEEEKAPRTSASQRYFLRKTEPKTTTDHSDDIDAFDVSESGAEEDDGDLHEIPPPVTSAAAEVPKKKKKKKKKKGASKKKGRVSLDDDSRDK